MIGRLRIGELLGSHRRRRALLCGEMSDGGRGGRKGEGRQSMSDREREEHEREGEGGCVNLTEMRIQRNQRKRTSTTRIELLVGSVQGSIASSTVVRSLSKERRQIDRQLPISCSSLYRIDRILTTAPCTILPIHPRRLLLRVVAVLRFRALAKLVGFAGSHGRSGSTHLLRIMLVVFPSSGSLSTLLPQDLTSPKVD